MIILKKFTTTVLLIFLFGAVSIGFLHIFSSVAAADYLAHCKDPTMDCAGHAHEECKTSDMDCNCDFMCALCVKLVEEV